MTEPPSPSKRRVAYGDRRMSFTMQPCGRDGHPINGGSHYANAHTLADARDFARRVLDSPDGRYLGYVVWSVEITGCVHEFRGHAWVPQCQDSYHHEVILPEPSPRVSTTPS